MIKRMILIRGLPGSTKSSIAQEYKKKHKDSCFICATDDYWMRPDNLYDFNYELLGRSHLWNQRRVLNIIHKEIDNKFDTIIVVDNTNITFNEMKPYIEICLRYKSKMQIFFEEPRVEWKYDVEECFRRNTHGVPYATILRMYNQWEDHNTVIQKLTTLKEKFGRK
jgi:tRNA uridine 5-carbamoylmethylation protein Kti12